MDSTQEQALNLDEEGLVTRAQSGDATAVGALYDQHQAHIFRYLWSRVHDQQLAEDLTGEVFIRMVANLPDYRQSGVPFRAWLYRIAFNLMTDHFRSENGRAPLPIGHAEPISQDGQNPSHIVETQMTLEQVQRALEQLDPVQRNVVELRFLAGLSLREVADTLDKTVAAVKAIQHRGLKALRHTLKQDRS